MGGSDQWGNIVAGCDLIRRLRGAKAHGLVMPLLTTASGTKFGKTEGGAVWLDPELTRPYQFYQFWLNADDRDAVRYLRFFTFLDAARIDELEAATVREPERRAAQRELAREVTRLVHGDAAVIDAESAARRLFDAEGATSVSELLQVFRDVPSADAPYSPERMARCGSADGVRRGRIQERGDKAHSRRGYLRERPARSRRERAVVA